MENPLATKMEGSFDTGSIDTKLKIRIWRIQNLRGILPRRVRNVRRDTIPPHFNNRKENAHPKTLESKYMLINNFVVNMMIVH